MIMKNRYELIGHDRFSHEDYSCGTFKTIEAARKAKAKREKKEGTVATINNLVDAFDIRDIEEDCYVS